MILKKHLTSFSLLVFSYCSLLGESVNVQGNVATNTACPVRHAKVTFINQNDSSVQLTDTTDSLGYYRLTVTSGIDRFEYSFPNSVSLNQNYPNPFSGTTTISYQINHSSDVKIKIFNLLGQEIRELTTGRKTAGYYGLTWDGRDKYGKKVSPGIYFYQMQTEKETHVKKMLYGLGESASTQILSDRRSNKNVVSKPLNSTINQRIYTVYISSTDSTQPTIFTTKVTDIWIASDTTINFSVQEDTSAGYTLFIGSLTDYILMYDTKSKTVVDSLGGFNRCIYDIEITNNKKKLYVCSRAHAHYDPCVYSVNLETKVRSVLLNRWAEIFISPSGIPFILAWDIHDTLKQIGTIDTLTDCITWIDSLNILGTQKYLVDKSVVFDPDEPVLYTFNGEHSLYKYNYQTKTISRTYESCGYYGHRMVIDPTGKYIYIAGGPAIDVACDTIAGYFAFGAASYNGTPVLSLGGNILYVTDPGGYLNIEVIPSGKVAAYHELPLGMLSEDVSYIDVKDSTPDDHGYQTDIIVITDNGQKAYVSNWINLIYVIDLISESVIDVIDFNRNDFQSLPLLIISRKE